MGPIDALYEDGVLRPTSPLPLQAGERVAIIVIRRTAGNRWDPVRLVAHGEEDLALAKEG